MATEVSAVAGTDTSRSSGNSSPVAPPSPALTRSPSPSPTASPSPATTASPTRLARARHDGRTIARLARQVELATAEVDLTLSQYRVLTTLDIGCEAASRLALKLAVSRPSITGVVDGLVARGLVRRSQQGPDRRRVQLDLTPAGREILSAADAAIERRLLRIDELTGELIGSPVGERIGEQVP